MAIISTGNHPKALWPGVYAWWGIEYAKHGDERAALFDMKTSKKAYEELVESTGFNAAPIKTQGGSIHYETHQQGPVTRAIHYVIGQGYIVTEEELEDNLYGEVSNGRASANAFAIHTTVQINAADIYNRAGNPNYTFGDGKELLATDHPTQSGDQSNELNPGAALSETALEDLIIQIGQANNNKGLPIALMAQSLHVPVNLEFEATRILKSALQNDTANNALNALKQLGSIPKGVKVNHYFSDANNYFVRTNVPTAGMCCFVRRAPTFSKDNDFDTGNAKAKGTTRLSFTVGDFRALYGSLPA